MAFDSNVVNFLTVGDFATNPTYAMPLSQQLVTSSTYGLNFANAGAGSTYTLQTTGNMRALMTLQSTSSVGLVVSTSQVNGGLITRSLTGSSTILVGNGSGTAGNPTLSAIASSSVQLINTQVSGVAIGSARSTLNFVPGANIGINAIDSGTVTTITINSTASSVIGSAPVLTFTANANLTSAQNLGLLTTGLVKNTVTAGSALLSTAVAGTDYLLPNANLSAFAALTPANGDILYYSGSTWTVLSPGATGTVLTVAGPTALGWSANGVGDVTLSGAQTFTGIKTFTPKQIFTNSIQIPLGGAVGKVLGSDASGNAAWTVAGAGDVTLAGTNVLTGLNTFSTPPVLSLASAVSNTLPITANVIPGTSITYTGTLPTGALFGSLSYVNYLSSTGVSTPYLRYLSECTIMPDLQTITFTGVGSLSFMSSSAFSALTNISVPDAVQVSIGGSFTSLTTLSCPNAINFSVTFGSSTITPGGSNFVCPLLTTLSLPKVISLQAAFAPTLGLLTTFSMPSLAFISGYGSVGFSPVMPLCTTVNLPALVNAQNFQVSWPLVTTLNLPLLAIVSESLLQSLNLTLPVLTTLSLPSLVQTGADCSMVLNACTSFSMPVYQLAGGINFTLPVLTNLSFPALTTLTKGITITAALATTVSFPVLATVATNIALTFASLVTLSLPALVSVGTTFVISAVNMTTFSLGSTLKSIGGNFTMSNMKLNQASVDGILVSLAALDGTNGTTAYSSKTILINGGTSSTPSATGLTAKATLVARGCTVTNN